MDSFLPWVTPELGDWELNYKLQLLKCLLPLLGLLAFALRRRLAKLVIVGGSIAYAAIALTTLMPRAIEWEEHTILFDARFIPAEPWDPPFWKQRQHTFNRRLSAAVAAGTISDEDASFVRPLLALNWLHGTTSATLALLPASDWTLVPSGYLTEIVPLAGELGEGMVEEGLNKRGLSGGLLEAAERSITYATNTKLAFHPFREEQLIDRLLSSNRPLTEEEEVRLEFAVRRVEAWGKEPSHHLPASARHHVHHAFPIVFGSTTLQPEIVNPQLFEVLWIGPARLGTDVQVAFVPSSCVKALRRSLETAGLSDQITIYTFADLRRASKICCDLR